MNAASPHSAIHGGPNTPKYEGDVVEFFSANPSVDITVRGEGEETFAAILEALEAASGTCARPVALRDVAGTVVPRRRRGRSHRGPTGSWISTRSRRRTCSACSSRSAAGHIVAMLETNRGCPYGCTFCDWGSATLSRIRKFDLERVNAELEWFAQNEYPASFIADANFGIIERDVEIAEKIAELKSKYGYPKTVGARTTPRTR